MTQNPYQVLGVPNGADLAECTQAYKRLAKKYHPDLNPGDRVAEAKMAEVNAAFDAIKNGNTADSTSTGSRRSADAGSDYYTAVVNFINHGQYAQAINLLGNMDKSDTRWYYLAALAYMGYGDQEKAMANIRIAVNREPNNANYQSAYNSIRQGINPMGFGFDPFSFFDFSAYTAGAGNTSAGNTGHQTAAKPPCAPARGLPADHSADSAGDLYHPPGDFGNHLLGELEHSIPALRCIAGQCVQLQPKRRRQPKQ